MGHLLIVIEIHEKKFSANPIELAKDYLSDLTDHGVISAWWCDKEGRILIYPDEGND